MTILGLTTSIPVGCYYNLSLRVENFGNSLSSAIQQFKTSNFQELNEKQSETYDKGKFLHELLFW